MIKELLKEKPGELEDQIAWLFNPDAANKLDDQEKQEWAKRDLDILRDAAAGLLGMGKARTLTEVIESLR